MLCRLIFIIYISFNILPSYAQVSSDNYIFQWGDLSKQVQKKDQRNSVSIKTDIQTLKNSINEPIFLLKNGIEKIELESFIFSIYNHQKLESTKFFQVDSYKSRKAAKIHGTDAIGHLISKSIMVNIVSIKAKDGMELSAYISLSDNLNQYEPSIKLPKVQQGEAFEFQVISFEDAKTILRIDTTNESTKHIVKVYSNPEKYQIIHLPNFKTTRRLIEESDFIHLKEVIETILIKDNNIANLDFSQVHEFTDYSKDQIPILLHWGDMKNMDYQILKDNRVLHTENRYLPEDVVEAIGKPLFLNLGYQDFEVVKMRVSFLPENGISTSFITDHLNYLEIKEKLETIQNQTTILFDQIFIKGQNGNPIFLPPAFVLIIE